MKFLNDFKNLFAILGVVSLIFWTCASESTSDDSSSNLPQITGGTYQVEHLSGGNVIVVLNTESGVMKTYYRNTSTLNIWLDYNDFDGVDRTITFTH